MLEPRTPVEGTPIDPPQESGPKTPISAPEDDESTWDDWDWANNEREDRLWGN